MYALKWLCTPLSILCLCGSLFAAESEIVTQPHAKASLVSELSSVMPGSSFHLALYLQLEDHWHVYWKNPGDSGMAPNVEWSLPPGVKMTEVLWPRPEKIPVDPLLNYGYHDSVLLPIKFSLDKNFSAESLTIKGQASWLVCKEVCIPGNATLALTLDTGEASASSKQPFIDAALALVPKPLALMSGSISEQGENLGIELYAAKQVFANAKKIDIFMTDANLIEYAAESQIRWKNNYLNFTQPKSATFHKLPKQVSGVMVVDDAQAWEFVVSQ